MKNKIKAILFAGALMLTGILAGSVTANAETPKILYSGTDGGVEWSIDENGHLLLTGDGDYEAFPDWIFDYYEEIKTATVKVKNMTDANRMFYYCINLKSVDFSEFDTSQITDMGYMFCGCESLLTLDLSNFKTHNVVTMNSMFEHCFNLNKVNLSSFDTSKVTNMSAMFYICKSLTSLDLSSWNLRALKNSDSMLYGMDGLVKIVLPQSPVEIKLPGAFYKGENGTYAKSYCGINGHTYSSPVFTWAEDYSSAKVYMECIREDCVYNLDDKQLQIDAVITKEIIRPTTEKEGATVYRATVVLKGKTYTDVKSIAIPKLPAQAKTAKAVGTTFKTSSSFYRVTKTGKTPEVAYMGPKNKKVKTVTIPATVKIDGVTYKVTSVATGALKNYKNLTKVIVGKNVTKIGKNAFYGCKKLKKIVIKGKKLKSVGKNAFKGIKKNATIDVPNSKKKAYKKLLKARTGFKKKTMKVK